MTDADTPFVRAVQAGEIDKYRVLVERHQNRIYGLLRHLVSDPDAAEDLAQEAFVRAYRAIDRFREESRFGTWLTQIAFNAARDLWRSRGRAEVISLEDLRRQEIPLPAVETGSADPALELEEGDLVRRLEKALAQIPGDYRQAFVLRHVEDIPYKRMAEITGDTAGTLKVRVHRARMLLREILSREDAGETRRLNSG